MEKIAFMNMAGRAPYASVGARHVCAQGCQFVAGREQFSKGERFAFAVNGTGRIAGTVRWVVKDRVGFAFDAPIAEEVRSALRAGANYQANIELYQDCCGRQD